VFQLIECKEAKCKRWLLTDEGNHIADNGSHEAAVFYSIPTEGITLDELMVRRLEIILDYTLFISLVPCFLTPVDWYCYTDVCFTYWTNSYIQVIC